MAMFPGNFDNGTTSRSTFTGDIASPTRIVTSAPFSKYLTERIHENSAFVKSGALALDARLNNVTGVLVELPFFDSLDYNEENIDSSNTWGDQAAGFLSTQRQTARTQYAPYVTRGAGFSMDKLSQYETGENALQNIASQLSRDMDRKMTAKLVSMLTGIFGPGGPLNATNSVDISEANAGTALTAANQLNAQTATAAKYILGETANNLKILVVHPDVAADLEVAGQLTFSSPAGLNVTSNIEFGAGGIGVTDTQIGWAFGMRVIVDSQVPIRGAQGERNQYVNYLLAPGVIRTGSQFPLAINTEYNAPSLQTNMYVNYSSIHHILGTSYVGANHPTNVNLATAASWEQAYADFRNVEVVELVTNAAIGGVRP